MHQGNSKKKKRGNWRGGFIKKTLPTTRGRKGKKRGLEVHSQNLDNQAGLTLVVFAGQGKKGGGSLLPKTLLPLCSKKKNYQGERTERASAKREEHLP